MWDVRADLLPCALVVLDGDRRILEANALFLEWVAAEASAVVGRPLAELLGEADPGELAELWDSAGFRRAVLVSTRPSERGEIVALFDANARARFELQLLSKRALEERTRSRLQLVIDASIAFAAAETEPQLATILADTVARAYEAEESVVFLTDEDGGIRQAAGTVPFDPELLQREGFVSRAVGLSNVVKISGATQADGISASLGRAMRETGVHAIIAAPLRHDDLSLGLFACFFHHPRQFDEEAAPLADALAGQAAQVATTLRLQRKLQHAATHDETTGLPNRRYLEEQSHRFEGPDAARVAAIFIDLDGFKRVNDELGHHSGDHLLREVGRRLQSALREDDIVARYGGDEFIVICEVPDISTARDVAERLRRNLGSPFDFLPDDFTVGASFGISIAAADGEPVQLDQLIRAADQAMYRSKGAGGNRIVIDTDPVAAADPTPPTAPIAEGPDLAEELRGAVARGEISAWFQPQIDVATGAIVAAEALCRWEHPQLGMIGPATFIPVAEDEGLIDEIGRYMAEQCYLALEAWSTTERPIDVSVNVSPLQLKSSEFTDWLAGQLEHRTFEGGRLTIEITESRPVVDIEAVVARLEGLRALGVGVAIDDFGAGHASLGQLERLHGTEVKLDRSLVSDLSDKATAEMANAITVARRAGIRVVAEGVETEEHLERVVQLGCERAQGYLISRPVPAADFASLLLA